jgi:hypothetical protein
MNPKADPFLWAAGRILDRLAAASTRTSSAIAQGVQNLIGEYRRLEKLWSGINKAHRHGWHLAAGRLREDLTMQIDNVACQTTQTKGALLAPLPRLPALSGILADLKQLSDEFEEVRIDLDDNSVIATTAPITLRDIELGPFDIELHIGRLDQRPDVGCFDCVAKDPHPAQTDQAVTHPHVKDDALCAGDATAPLSAALSQGRIFDAFCLIKAVLEEYNPASPYVSLDDWYGQRCDDCDRIVHSDDLTFCECCQKDFCDECISRCDLCDETVCRNCLEKDDVSGRYCCPNCRHTCTRCGRTVDEDSLDGPTSLCPGCLSKQGPKEQEEPHDPEPQSDPQPEPGHATQREGGTQPRSQARQAILATAASPDAGVCAPGVAEAPVVPARRRQRGRRVRNQRRR